MKHIELKKVAHQVQYIEVLEAILYDFVIVSFEPGFD